MFKPHSYITHNTQQFLAKVLGENLPLSCGTSTITKRDLLRATREQIVELENARPSPDECRVFLLNRPRNDSCFYWHKYICHDYGKHPDTPMRSSRTRFGCELMAETR